ncbi:MAG: right-handed parallel beta-helix repeat-containing protein, partial [Bacteroidales bacterium]|nr:right-handed parallel beta-helix repeat-containing protein [Bacteroidales bacterium]
ADGLVEVIDVQGKKCRLKSVERIPDQSGNPHSYILIPHWYRSSIYKIDRIEDSFIYFTATDLAVSYNKGYNVNDDFNYGKKAIRYKLCNVGSDKCRLSVVDFVLSLPEGVQSVREGDACKFIEVRNCKLGSLTLSGLEFRGSRYYDYSAAVIKLAYSDFGSATVSHCSFKGLRSHAVVISSSSNVSVEDCLFKDCYYDGVSSDNKSLNTQVVRNEFHSMGKRMENSFCVVCRGENYYVADNSLTDYGYGGIGVGVWYKHDKPAPSGGIVENNTLTFTPGYISAIDNYGLMDSGAIYIWTQNDGVVIRNNRINGFSGMKDNRGIFCDDGAYNVTIEGNSITGVVNSFSIDSRRVMSVESEKGSKVTRANVNNRVSLNTVDAPIRFEPREGDNNGCYFGENKIEEL